MIIIYNTNHSTKAFKFNEIKPLETDSLINEAKKFSAVCFIQEVFETYIDSAEDIATSKNLPFNTLLITDDEGNKLYKTPNRKIKQLIAVDLIHLSGFYTFGYIMEGRRKMGEWYAYIALPYDKAMKELKKDFGANMVISSASPTITPEIKRPLIKIYY